jgi:hypothetical protein
MINIMIHMADELEQKIVSDIKNKTAYRLTDIAEAHEVSLRAVYAIIKKYRLNRNRGTGSQAYRISGRSVETSEEKL